MQSISLERLKVILLEDRKLQILGIFCCQDIPKMSCKVKSNPLYKEWFIWTKFKQNHEPFTSLFYMLLRMHDMDKDFSCIAICNCIFLSFLFNIKPYNMWYWCSKHKKLFQNIWKNHIYLIRSVSITTEKTEFVRIKVPKRNKSYLACLKDKVEKSKS